MTITGNLMVTLVLKNNKDKTLYFTYLAGRFLTSELPKLRFVCLSLGGNQLCKVLSPFVKGF